MNCIDFRIGLLKCYNLLTQFIEQADFQIFNKALGTHNFGNDVREDTYLQVAAIVKIINQKNSLLSLKNTITHALNKLSEDKRKILALRYLKKFTPLSTMQKMGLSRSCYYSKMKKALTQFGGFIAADGYNNDWFCMSYACKNWFKRLINACNGLQAD